MKLAFQETIKKTRWVLNTGVLAEKIPRGGGNEQPIIIEEKQEREPLILPTGETVQKNLGIWNTDKRHALAK